MPKFTPITVHDLGDYLREQRQSAQLSLRQLSEVAGISNPYISQIERGLKKPSAEILQALAKGLRISAESLYIKAGMLDVRTDSDGMHPVDVTDAILADARLNDRQRAILLDVYESFVGESTATKALKTHAFSNKPPVPTKPPVPSVLTDPAKAGKAPKVAKVTKPGLAKSGELKSAPESTSSSRRERRSASQ
jgi:transcriptional regulator with XRE-family HTH domain